MRHDKRSSALSKKRSRASEKKSETQGKVVVPEKIET